MKKVHASQQKAELEPRVVSRLRGDSQLETWLRHCRAWHTVGIP